MRGPVFIVLFLFILLPLVSAEAQYTREHSEALFDLIDWQEYSAETFDRALKEQKPIFLMISAPAWCYWCHVYESKDYLYDDDLYPYINEHFIAVFVDSDKRPDLTRKYLEGGWPSTTIFSPDLRRIIGFTGPRDPDGLLKYLKELVGYLEDKEFTTQAFQLNYEVSTPQIPSYTVLQQIDTALLGYIEQVYDPVYGGFAPVPIQEWREGQKFPKGWTLSFLLEKYEETGNKKYLDMVMTTFRNHYTDIAELEERYRLYDPVEGGFHRYSTNRDWSIPHYEKMLPDQAKLIRAYIGLEKVTGDASVKEVVDDSLLFVENKLSDPEGGFYSSQDAYLEEEYFGLSAGEREKVEPPFIDRTRNIDSNAMMISTLLYSYDIYGEEKYRILAEKGLDFMENNLVDAEGANYYFDYEKEEAFLSGQTISNAWAILAFVDGYEQLGDKKYLKTAKKLADYSLNELYDWNVGGFFERNSKDTEFYAQNERVDLSKPYRENGVFAYGMLRLYVLTDDLAYLDAGLRTLGYVLLKNGGLEDTYFVMKASQVVEDYKLLDVYSQKQDKILLLVEERQENFFLDELLSKEQNNVPLDDAPQLLDEFANVSFLILALLAFFAGLLSFLSPCCLPVLSAYFAHNVNANKKEILKNTIFFILGLATVFSIFGMGATFVGSLFRENRLIFTQVAGALIIIFGVLEIFGKGFSGMQIRFKNKEKTPVGSYLFGLAFAVGWSACIGPILASLLLLSATTGTILKGSALLFVYTIGLGIPLIILSLYFGKIKNKKFWKMLKGRMLTFHVFGKQVNVHSTYLISGIILIIMGVLIFNDYLYRLNQYALQSTFVQETIIRGEEFLKKLFIR